MRACIIISRAEYWSCLPCNYTALSLFQLPSSASAPWQTGYFSVRVSDSSDIVDHEDECVVYDEEFPAGSSVALPCEETKYGRYLSIQRTWGPKFYRLSLCEVMVNGSPLGKQQTCISIQTKAREGYKARYSFSRQKMSIVIISDAVPFVIVWSRADGASG